MNGNEGNDLAEQLEKLKDSERELAGFTRIEGTGAKQPRAVFSLRLGADELEIIEAAAAVSDQSASEFVRQAALLRAREVASKGSAIEEVKAKARELNDAIGRL